jgi:hypothetical protein
MLESRNETPAALPSTPSETTSELLPRVLPRVQALLAEVLAEGKPFRAKLEHGELVAEMIVRAVGEAVPAEESPLVVQTPRPPPSLPPDARFLSQVEEKILGVVRSDSWTTAREIADKANVAFDKDLGGILRNMVDRGLLASCTGRGYRLREASEANEE